MGSNPKMSALLTGAVGAWLIYSVATATESPSLALKVLQYILIAGCVIGFVGAVRQLLSGTPPSPD